MKSIHSINLMWIEACEMLQRADRLQRQFFRLGQGGQIPVWEPPVDIFENEAGLLIRVAVPDVKHEDFEISIEGAVLRLSGRRCLPAAASQLAIRRLEIPYGQMERNLPLPPGRFRLTSTTYSHGCLDIYLQRVTENE